MHTRVLECCLTFMRSSDQSNVYSILLWLHECLKEYPPQWETIPDRGEQRAVDYQCIADNYHLLLNKSSDIGYLAVLKLNILELFIADDNVNILSDNIKSLVQTRYKNRNVCERAIRFAIAAREKHASTFNSVLEELLAATEPEVQMSMLRHVCTVSSYDDGACERLFNGVLPRWKSLSHQDLVVLLNMSVHFGFKQADNLSHMLALADNVCSLTSESSQALKVILLQSITSCFLAQPAEYELCLIKCLTSLSKDGDLLVRQQVDWCVSQVQSHMKGS